MHTILEHLYLLYTDPFVVLRYASLLYLCLSLPFTVYFQSALLILCSFFCLFFWPLGFIKYFTFLTSVSLLLMRSFTVFSGYPR